MSTKPIKNHPSLVTNIQGWVGQLSSLRKNGGEKWVREARHSLEDWAGKFQKSDLLTRARTTALEARNQVFSVLSIPSQEELSRLSRRIAHLETRVNELKRKAA